VGVCMCGFCNVWVCVCVGFVMCGCLYVLVFVCVGLGTFLNNVLEARSITISNTTCSA